MERKYTFRGGEHLDVDDLFMSKSCQIQYLLLVDIGLAEITDNFLDKSTNSNNYIAFPPLLSSQNRMVKIITFEIKPKCLR